MLAAVGGVLAISALAHEASYESVVTIDEPKPGVYEGRVKSDFAPCKRSRLVKVFVEQMGGDEKIGQDRTNRRGRWRVVLDAPGDNYYAKVSRKTLSPGSHRHVCKPDASPTI